MKKFNTNPVDLGITCVQEKVYQIIVERYKSGQLTTRSDIQNALGGKDKSWICRVLRALRDKGLIERYEQRYYRATKKRTKWAKLNIPDQS